MHRIYKLSFASLYSLYLTKVQKKGRSKQELDEVITWLTGYDVTQTIIDDLESFFASAPNLNPARRLITGKICGVQIDEIAEPLMREIRYMDKLVDELAKGRKMEKILRG